MKKAMFLPVMLLVSVLTFGTMVNAAACPACEMAGVHTEMQTYGTHLWHHSYYHLAEYSIDEVLYQEDCNYVISEDKVDWVCPKGHGLISTMTHHTETHSCSHCNNLSYYY